MKTLAEQLKEALENTPTETLQAEWDEIVAMGFNGPLMADFFGIVEPSYPPTEDRFIDFSLGLSEDYAGENNYAMAA